jgi:hypothetical protein
MVYPINQLSLHFLVSGSRPCWATVGGVIALEALSGQVEAGPDQLRLNTTTKIVSMNLAGAVFGPGGKIQYFGENEAK